MTGSPALAGLGLRFLPVTDPPGRERGGEVCLTAIGTEQLFVFSRAAREFLAINKGGVAGTSVPHHPSEIRVR